MAALLENGLSDIKCCYHSNIFQIYVVYNNIMIYDMIYG